MYKRQPVFRSDLAALMARLTEPAPAQPEGERFAVLAGARVLVVEDNEINLDIAAALLEDAGAVVARAQNGQEAVERFSEAPEGFYDLVLMDVQMPVLDGCGATRALSLIHIWSAGAR